MTAFRVFSNAYEKKFLLFTSFKYTLSSIQMRKIDPRFNVFTQNNLCFSPISSTPKYVCHSKLLHSFDRMTWICSSMRQSSTSFVFELAELQHWYWCGNYSCPYRSNWLPSVAFTAEFFYQLEKNDLLDNFSLVVRQ